GARPPDERGHLARRLALRRPGRGRAGRAPEPQVGVRLSVPSSLAGILGFGERDDAALDRGNGSAAGHLTGRGSALPRRARRAYVASLQRVVWRRAATLRRGARPG